MTETKFTVRQKIYLPIKRLIDIIFSLLGIFFCFALFWWWIIIVNFFVSHKHPFFVQERMGKNGKMFKIYKFRSSKPSTNPNACAETVSKDEYTHFGNFLRKTSLDETPQLINIFLGKMSFIGPRPLINFGVDKTTNELRIQNGSIRLRPGLSGYSQIVQRDHLSAEEKAKFDYVYLQKFGLFFDLKVFILSVIKAVNW